ncbi:hypothetical protein [Mucilaginibacter defluvii]|uniref:Uncharacterized protein n=1 Tax=Mucilaginibacter defluvii TaxID=1196019 RepID=A0ABP9FZI5_9SPHI
MIYRTGFTLNDNGIERYIQVETILAFYEQQFVNTGKHLLFEDEMFIGNVTLDNVAYTLLGFDNFDDAAKAAIKKFLKELIVPHQQELMSAFGFGIQSADELIFCEVILKDKGIYTVWMNGSQVAELTQDSKCNWQQLTGEKLRSSVFREITEKVEGYYNQF